MGLRAAIDGLTRHARSIARFWSSSLAAEMEYQLNLLIEVAATLGTLAGSLFSLSLFYGHGAQLGGWSWDAALVVLGFYTLLDGFSTTLLRPNLGQLVKQVQNGGLDFVLLKPMDSQIWLSLRTISPWGLPEMLLGVVLIVLGSSRAGATFSPMLVLCALLMLLSGLLILYSLWFVLAATSIWFVKVWNATEVLRSLLAAGRYPVTAYPPGLRVLFSSLLPVAFLTTVPAQAMLGMISAKAVLLSLLIAAVSVGASRALWTLALRHYTSASS